MYGVWAAADAEGLDWSTNRNIAHTSSFIAYEKAMRHRSPLDGPHHQQHQHYMGLPTIQITFQKVSHLAAASFEVALAVAP